MPGQDLVLNFKVNDQGSAALQKMQSSIGGIQTAISAINASAFVYLGQQAIAAGEKLYNLTKSIADAGNEISRMSQISGLSVTRWQEWSGAAYLANVNQDSLARGLKFLSRSMSDSGDTGKAAGQAFSAMGISVTDASGRTKSLDTMMGEVANKFASWEDGPRKIAIALAIFGRSGQDMIPILNQGKQGIQELQGEINKLGVILGVDTVTKLAEAEKKFREIDLVFTAIKANLTPIVALFTTFGLTALETFNKISNWFKSNPEFLKLFSYTIPGLAGIVPSKAQIEQAEFYKYPQYEAPPGAKKEAPALVNPDNPYNIKGFSLSKTTEELNKLKAQAAGASPFGVGWGAEETTGVKAGEMAIEGMTISIKDYATSLDLIDKAYLKLIDVSEIAGTTQEEMNKMTERYIILENERTASILDLTKQYADLTDNLQLVISVDKASEDEYIRINNLTDQQISLIRLLGNERRSQLANKEIVDEATSVAQGMSSAWSSGLMDMFKGTQSFADGMKKIFTDMGDIIIKKLLEITANYLLMGNITGSKITGGLFGGIGNLLGIGGGGGGAAGASWESMHLGGEAASAFGEMSFYQHGTPYVPETGPAILHKGEAVIPANKNKGGDTNTTNVFIQATDVGSFAKLYGPTIESIYWKGKRFNKVSMRNQ